MKIDSVVNWVERVASLPNKGLHWVAMVVLLLLMFLTVADVVGRYLDREKFNKMIDEFYEYKGLDKNGVPNPETLKRLGLEKEPSRWIGTF